MVHHKETSRIAVFEIGIFLFQLFKQVATKKVAAQEGMAYAAFSASIKKHSKKSKDDGKPKIPEEY